MKTIYVINYDTEVFITEIPILTESDQAYIFDYERLTTDQQRALDWAKENIPNINVPRVFFMPTVKYLKERYNIEFKDKPQWEFYENI